MQEELKRCPFCGGKPELSPSGYVFCQKCLARTYELGNGAATWNKREHEREASINDLTVKVAQLEARLAALDTTLDRIKGWCEAYPLEMFPEPDLKNVQRMLGDDLLSQVSAHNMRHVLKGITRIINEGAGSSPAAHNCTVIPRAQA